MFVNIQDAWKRNVRVFGSSLHLIHFNDMWRRARATQNFQTVGTSRDGTGNKYQEDSLHSFRSGSPPPL